MLRRSAIGFLFLALASALLSSGCATLTRSRRQWIPVTSSPPGATVIVNGRREGVTPLTLRPVRKEKGQVIRIEYPGYDPVEIRLIRKTSGAFFIGNLLLGLIPAMAPAGAYSLAHDGSGALSIWIFSAAAIGALFTAVDSGGGNMNEFKPQEITVKLSKSDGRSRVNTMLVVADDLQTVKSIRIHRD